MYLVGNPAISDDFFNRHEEIQRILRDIYRDNLLLKAPRRYGKTSIMREVERRFKEKGHLCLFLDVHAVDSSREFLFELCTSAFDEPSRATF